MILLNYSYFVFKVLEDCHGDLKFWYRHISKGGWPFSTADNGWTTSDCTAEGLKLHIPRIIDYLWIAEDSMKMQVHENTCYMDIFIVYFSCAGCSIII